MPRLPALMIAVGWVAILLSVLSFIAFAFLVIARSRPGGGVVRELKGGEEGWAKVGEAIAKIVDSLGKAGPAISALVISVVFLVLAYFAARLDVQRPPSRQPEYRATSAVRTCSVSGFPEGGHRSLGSDGRDDFSRLLQTPPGCVEEFITTGGRNDLVAALLIGRVDKRELKPEVLRVYGSNLGLAYQRALTLKAYLVARYQRQLEPGRAAASLDTRLIPLSAGPEYVDGAVSSDQRSKDRCVDIITYRLEVGSPPGEN